jgi:hypothetical protein
MCIFDFSTWYWELGAGTILFTALGAFGDYMMWGIIGGVLLLILAAIAK